ETEKDFNATVSLLEKVKPGICNISRFGARPNTPAEKMPQQLHGRVKKERSRVLSALCASISLEQNKTLLGSSQEILVTEIGPKGNFVGRTLNYKPVAIKQNALGKFVKVKVTAAFQAFLEAKPLKTSANAF
ncbi:MAG: TRAM domain-containing protein, partial [Candidatus Diapherotrites archaeon]